MAKSSASTDPLQEEIYRILSEEFSVPRSEISDEIGPGDLPKWDSIGQIRLISRLEETFHIQFSIHDMMSINRAKDLAAVVKKLEKVSGKKGTGAKEKAALFGVSVSPLRLPKTTVWGEGALSALNQMTQSRIAVLTGSSKYAAQIRKRLDGIFPDNRTISYFQKPPGETAEPAVYDLADKLRGSAAEAIVVIGGGSSIDLAKLSWALYEHPQLKLEDLATPFSLPPLRRKATLTAIPTTFGSGAEVSSAATVSRQGETRKTIVLSHEFLPDQVILDPSLGLGTPLPTVYHSAFDALTHAIEGYVSLVKNPLAEPYAVSAIKNIFPALKQIQKEGLSLQALTSLCASSYYAGIVQNHCSVGLTHAIAHQLGGFGVPHGLGNALFLIPVMEINAVKTDRYESLAAQCGFHSFKQLVTAIRQAFSEADLHLDAKTREKIVKGKSVIAEGAMKDITFKTNPVAVSRKEVEALLETVKHRP